MGFPVVSKITPTRNEYHAEESSMWNPCPCVWNLPIASDRPSVPKSQELGVEPEPSSSRIPVRVSCQRRKCGLATGPSSEPPRPACLAALPQFGPPRNHRGGCRKHLLERHKSNDSGACTFRSGLFLPSAEHPRWTGAAKLCFVFGASMGLP